MSNTKIPLRQLGRNGPMVSALGYGAMGLSGTYGSADDEVSVKLLNKAIDLGCTFWDTSDLYGVGHNEKLLSRVLATRRNEIFLATKFAIVVGKNGPRQIRGDAAYVKEACDASLKRLGISTIDLYYQHRVDPNTPIEVTVGAMKELVKEGKVRYLGLSECSAATLRRAHKVHPISCVQMEYSPWCLDIEQNGILATCRELGIAIVPYSPLGRGFLSGEIKSPDDIPKGDFRKTLPRFRGEAFKTNLELVKAFESMAKAKGTTASALCLAWVFFQGPDMIPIPGTRREKALLENLSSLKVNFTKEDDAKIRAILSKTVGERYTADGMRAVNL
ncbi:hypothetical protein SmJEL517_g04707 [Synchytrium microbalum]|uniref:NADP-dependent oxidoreductase domain-containing protein n=1 Tax=Synchytrium microbalum TaxID=1806994 RepID=A0A507BYC7_9FUNG|nr:uncharacterized protein SmJEL517_g04707 [Synchytrium microbalum]TPX32128.1 hypothetical protein SmJEL517_g04707 [Synchytrium microbalum]